MKLELVFVSLLVRWIVVVWLRAYPSCVRWCLFASLEVVLVERGVWYSRLLYKSSSVEVPSVGVLGGQVSGLEILHGVEAGT